MKIRLNTQQIQKQVLAPVMQQSIEVLLLPIAELRTVIELELQNNPLLDLAEEATDHGDPATIELDPGIKEILNHPDVHNYSHFTDDEVILEQPVKEDVPLEDQLLQQLRLETSDPLQLKIGESIIGNLDEDGYLTISLEEIARNLNLNGTDEIEKILRLIQQFEPAGIAARNLAECLFIQVHRSTDDLKDLMLAIIRDYLKELSQKKYAFIAKKLNRPLNNVKKAAQRITGLEPKPARNYRPVNTDIYIKPDIVVRKNKNSFQVAINDEALPVLRINPTYKRLLEDKGVPAAEKAFIKERLNNALQFIRSIEQRGSTIKRIAQYIVDRQQAFFEQGAEALIPMKLKDVAAVVERNESTVSRAISNKYIDTPQGTFPLKFFFSQGLQTNNGNSQTENVSSRSIKEAIKKLINQENSSAPLSDQDIQDHFARQGITLARRTVAKYRQSLRIFPSHLRKK